MASMKMKNMDQPMTRCEFERRFNILRERIRNGKMMFAKDAVRHGIAGLTNVRCLPNGRIDFLSVNEMARLQANSTVNFLENEEFKEMIKQQASKNREDDQPEDEDSY